MFPIIVFQKNSITAVLTMRVITWDTGVNKPIICVYFFIYISFFRSDIPLDQLLRIVIMNLVLLQILVKQIIITTQRGMIKRDVITVCYDHLKS